MTDPRRFRTVLLVVLVASAGAWVVLMNWPTSWPNAFWFWLAACFAGELLWVKLPLGGATLSMASCFNYAALLVLPPAEAVLATTLATVLGERIALRKPFMKVAYNSAHTALAVAAGAALFDLASGGNRDLVMLLSKLQLAPIVLSGLAYYAINRAAVVAAIASSEGVDFFAGWKRNFGSSYEVLSAGAIFSLGALLATHYQGIGMAGTLLVALPLLLACDGLRRFNEFSATHEEQRPPDDRKAA
jgi:hypothetical protein